MTPHELRAALDRLDLSAAEAGHLLGMHVQAMHCGGAGEHCSPGRSRSTPAWLHQGPSAGSAADDP
jgi:hypothetical protein